jgi:kynurenine formamidase
MGGTVMNEVRPWPTPTRDEMLDYIKRRNNSGRWGPDDQIGTLNLITQETRLQAFRQIETAETMSLSRPVPTETGVGNLNRAHHYISFSRFGAPVDFLGMYYHGRTYTHIDALCHVAFEGKLYNDRDLKETITFTGATFGGIETVRNGVFTRAWVLDVPRYRGERYVTKDKPVEPAELFAIAEHQAINIEPGDAVCVYSGREAYEMENPPMGSEPIVPGLHTACLQFFRETDVSVLLWDMIDTEPSDYGFIFGMHTAIPVLGLHLVDNCILSELAKLCQERGRQDFTLALSPLYVRGGTGSPANPIAIF